MIKKLQAYIKRFQSSRAAVCSYKDIEDIDWSKIKPILSINDYEKKMFVVGKVFVNQHFADGSTFDDACVFVHCKFGKGCEFGQQNVFERCEFEEHNRFGNRCFFGDFNVFKDYCVCGDGCILGYCLVGKKCKFGTHCWFTDNFSDIEGSEIELPYWNERGKIIHS